MEIDEKLKWKVWQESKPVFRQVQLGVSLFIVTQPTSEHRILAGHSIIFQMATLLQELAIAACDGDAEAGMRLVSAAINHSNVSAVNRIKEVMKE